MKKIIGLIVVTGIVAYLIGLWFTSNIDRSATYLFPALWIGFIIGAIRSIDIDDVVDYFMFHKSDMESAENSRRFHVVEEKYGSDIKLYIKNTKSKDVYFDVICDIRDNHFDEELTHIELSEIIDSHL